MFQCGRSVASYLSFTAILNKHQNYITFKFDLHNTWRSHIHGFVLSCQMPTTRCGGVSSVCRWGQCSCQNLSPPPTTHHPIWDRDRPGGRCWCSAGWSSWEEETRGKVERDLILIIFLAIFSYLCVFVRVECVSVWERWTRSLIFTKRILTWLWSQVWRAKAWTHTCVTLASGFLLVSQILVYYGFKVDPIN